MSINETEHDALLHEKIVTSFEVEELNVTIDGTGLLCVYVSGENVIALDREKAVLFARMILSGYIVFDDSADVLGAFAVEINEVLAKRAEQNQEDLAKIQGRKAALNKKLSLPREYFCHDCKQLRLDLKGATMCGNCGSENMQFGEVNSEELSKLRKNAEWSNL